jgi:hypothetical protein
MSDVRLVYFFREEGIEHDIITMRFTVPKGFDLRSDFDVLELFQSLRHYKDICNKVREELFHKYVRKG